MTNNAKTQIILVTGFLGAGKTTLLNRLIESTSATEMGIIVNDFGEVVVDGELIRHRHPNPDLKESILEIPNGSIFCSCLKDAFLNGLLYFAGVRPQQLFIETSGMSDPSSMQKLIGSDKLFSAVFELKSVYCLVDALGFLDLVDHFSFIQSQLLASNLAIITKTEHVDEGTLSAIQTRIRGINPQLSIRCDQETSAEWFRDIESICRTAEPVKDTELFQPCEPVFHHPTAYEKPRSIFLRNKPVGLETISRFFQDCQAEVYRVKGFVETEGGIYYVDGVNGGVSIKKSSATPDRLGVSLFATEMVRESLRQTWDNL